MRPGRPATSRAVLLDAAHAVFAAAAVPQAVTMDEVATGAGVGKGTIFRAFGDRDGLLDALIDARFDPLRAAVIDGTGVFAPDVTPGRRLAAFLDAVLDFKLDNRKLMLARELVPAGTNVGSHRYRWMHGVVRDWVDQAAPAAALSPSYVAHALLLPLQIDLVDHLLSEGVSVAQLKRQQAMHGEALLGQDRWPG